MSKKVAVAVALLAGTLLAGGAGIRSLIVARRQVRVTVINETSRDLHDIEVIGANVRDLGPGERGFALPSESESMLWSTYVDDRGERHVARSFDCFGECSYWPACSRPVVRIRESGTAFEDGPSPPDVVKYLLGCGY